MAEVAVYSMGIVACSACAPLELSAEQVAEAVNAEYLTGISSDWQVSSDPTFKGGEPNPAPCNTDPGTRRHWLLNC